MRELTLGQFLDRLASSDPTPGGGSASAIAGAMAAALVSMVARLSQGKGGDDEAFGRMVEQAEGSRRNLTALAEEDARAFDGVMQAMRMPRGTEEEKRTRQAAMQQALRGAAEVPMRAARETLAVLQAGPELARRGNANAVSDVAVAVLLGYAAVNGALYNVRINLKSIKDEVDVAEGKAEVRRVNQESAALRDEAMAAVRERM